MKPSLDAALTPESLRRLAGSKSFERGEEYFERGRVDSLSEKEGGIRAKVRGSHLYLVKLWPESDELGYSCTCPHARDGAFCKHVVAVGLAWLNRNEPPQPKLEKTKPAVTMGDVHAHLSGLDKKDLVDLIMTEARQNDAMHRRLLLRAAKRGPKRLDLATYREAFDNTIHPGDYIDYRAMYEYTSAISEVVDSVEELLEGGHAAEIVELTEYAMREVEKAFGSVDDSDGGLGGILEDLQDLHHKACVKAKPDPEELAKRIFEWEVRTEWDTFYNALERYADVLGERGLAVYKKLATAQWDRLPPLGPGKERDSFGSRYRITHIMESLARRTGDVEALVAVKAKDLSSSFRYLDIAEVYRKARRREEARAWAEKALKAFPDDSGIREFLADEYHHAGRNEEALALIWAEFTDRPHLDRYQLLKRHAGRVGHWKRWRDQALAFLRKDISSDRSDHSRLVEIFLWEDDVDTAWEEAKKGGCSQTHWFELAERRAKAHPEESLPIYQAHVDTTLTHANKDAYHQAVGLLRKIRDVMDRREDFVAYVASVRAAHKAKRNFVKLLDHAKWG